MTAVATTMHSMMHDKDPADIIRQEVGDISGIELLGHDVLLGVYVRPEKTKGGIILTPKQLKEDLYQGKVGLVLKVSPRAYDETKIAPDQRVKEGDWIFYYPEDTRALTLAGHKCRLIQDVNISGRLAHPDIVI